MDYLEVILRMSYKNNLSCCQHNLDLNKYVRNNAVDNFQELDHCRKQRFKICITLNTLIQEIIEEIPTEIKLKVKLGCYCKQRF